MAKDLVSAAFYRRQASARAAVSPCSATMSVGALQTAVDSLRVSPLNVQRSTHSSQKAASCGQRLLPFRKELLPISDNVSVGRSDERLLNNNRLFQFPTSSNDLQIQQINRSLQPSADTSVGSTMTSARSTSRKPFLSDEEILELIENKLKKFRTQMALKRRGPSASSLNVQASSSPQGSSPVMSSASGAVVKAAENMAARAGDGENPNGSGKKPEGTQMESAPNDKHFTECDRSAIIAAVHSNIVDENHDSMVLRATFGSPLGELVTENPGFTVHHKPNNHEHNAAATADSTLGWLPPKSLACTVYNQQPFGTDSDNETSHTVETSNLIKSNSSAGLGNLTLNSSQIFNVNKVPDVTSSVANYRQVTEPEPQRKEPTEQRVDIGVQVGEDRIEMDKREWSSIQGYPEFEDITDDESDITQQVSIQQESTHHITQIREFMQSPKPITNVESSTNVTSEPAERPTPKQQEPKVPLACSCPYFVETDDGFEKVPCPKCAQATPFTKEEEESEEESDSEEVILFVSDLVLEDEIIDLVSSDDEEEENVSSAEQQNQNAIFQPVEEFETFASFYESKVKQLRKDLPNPLVATGAKPVAPAESEPPLCTLSKNVPVEKVDSEQVLPHCSSQKRNSVEKASEIAPAPKLLGISEKFSPDLIQSPRWNEDNSSDTDDSSDYPSHTQSNYLTASLRAPSPQSSDSSIEELGESLQSPPETLDTSGWFPVLTPDIQSDVEAANQPTVASKTTTGPVESTDGSKTPFRKAKYKSRRVIESDSESEDDQDGHETGSSAKNSVDWDQRDVGPVKSVQNSSGLQRFEKSSSKLPATSVSSTQPLKSSLKPQSSSLSTHLPEPRPEAHAQNVSSVSRKVLDNVDQSTAFKQKKTKTDPKSNRQVKRKRPSPDTGKQCSQIMAEQASGSRTHAPPGANAQNATPNLSKEPNGKLVLYSEGKPYRASSLPPQNHSQLTSNLIRKTQPNPQTPPKSHDSPLSSNVNSYSTAKSAPAKQGVVKDWSNRHISIPKERRRSHEAEQPIKAQNVKTKPCPPKRRRRCNSQNLHGPLMKKSKRQAQTWTKAVHYKESSIPSEANIGDRYKWKEKKPVEVHVDDEWLDRMHGEPFKRPHY